MPVERSRDVYEWWPDYGSGPRWLRTGRGGVAVDLGLLNLPDPLKTELITWHAVYDEARIPSMESEGDPERLAHGAQLIARTREALTGQAEVIVTEPWWGAQPWTLRNDA